MTKCKTVTTGLQWNLSPLYYYFNGELVSGGFGQSTSRAQLAVCCHDAIYIFFRSSAQNSHQLMSRLNITPFSNLSFHRIVNKLYRYFATGRSPSSWQYCWLFQFEFSAGAESSLPNQYVHMSCKPDGKKAYGYWYHKEDPVKYASAPASESVWESSESESGKQALAVSRSFIYYYLLGFLFPQTVYFPACTCVG